MERMSRDRPDPGTTASEAIPGGAASPGLNSPAHSSVSGGGSPAQPVAATPGVVENLLGANATRHVLYLLDGQYLYQYRTADDLVRYKFLSARSVRLALSGEAVDSGWLPAGLVRWGFGPRGQWAVLFVPPARHRVWLPPEILHNLQQPARSPERAEAEAEAGVAGELPGPPGREVEATPLGDRAPEPVLVEIPLPGLVFAGSGQHYYVWAIKGAAFDPLAVAYHAPLPNVYPDGLICWGNNRVGAVSPATMPDAWQLFMGSPFNSHLTSGKSRRSPNNVLDTLGRLASPVGYGAEAGVGAAPKVKRRRGYPPGDLKPLTGGWEQKGVTVGALVERFVHSQPPT